MVRRADISFAAELDAQLGNADRPDAGNLKQEIKFRLYNGMKHLCK
jgi:hypothetical protein